VSCDNETTNMTKHFCDGGWEDFKIAYYTKEAIVRGAVHFHILYLGPSDAT
jgi:hypothetical protein